MGNFNKGNKFGGGRSFGGGGRGGNRGFGGGRGGDGSRPQMHKATCSDCGNSCEVPFRPTGDKPVFCSDCFKNKGNDNSRNFRGGGNRDFGDRNSRPRFADNQPHQHDGGRNTENYRVQFEQLNTKLDTILKVLAPSEEIGKTEVSKSKKFQKDSKKETDTAALKKAIIETIDTKPTTKKETDKKPAAKKSVAKKKTVAKEKK